MWIKIFFKNLFHTLFHFKVPSAMMLIGLAVAYSAFFIILIQLDFEHNYNKSFSDYRHIYQLEYYDTATDGFSPFFPKGYSDYLSSQLPELTHSCIYGEGGKVRIMFEDSHFTTSVGYADTGIVSVFNLDIIAGDYRSALSVKNNVMLPQSFARKIFQDKNPIGQSLLINEKEQFTVAALYKDLPPNSSLKNLIYICLPSFDDWNSWVFCNYYRIVPAVDIKALEERINETGKLNDRIVFSSLKKLRPLQEVYYASEGNKMTSSVLLFIGILILIVAFINFINYINSLAPTRLKWFNIQKIYGMPVLFLRLCLISETVFFSFISCLLGFIVCMFIAESPVQTLLFSSANPFSHSFLAFEYVFLSIIIGVIIGIYPAYYTTNFPPAVILGGKNRTLNKGKNLRSILVVFQFITSIVLIILTVFTYKQLGMLRDQSWGIQKDKVLYMQINKDIEKHRDVFAGELRSHPQIVDVTFSSEMLGDFSMEGTDIFIGGAKKRLWYYANSVTPNYADFWGIKIEEGQSRFIPTDTCAIANETFVKITGREQTLDKRLGRIPIQSICSDFNFKSLKSAVKPLILYVNESYSLEYCFIKTSVSPTHELMSFINNKAKTLSPFYEGEINMVNDYLNSKYSRESNFGTLISLFCIISVLLSLMGTFSLVLFNFRFRIKEIGIRKVQGATVIKILILLNKGYLKLITIAFFIAAPVAWCLISLWLRNFAYKISLSMSIFFFSGLFILFVTFLTISWHSWKTACINPVDVLKAE